MFIETNKEEEKKSLIKKRSQSENNIELIDNSQILTALFKKIENKRNSLKTLLILLFFFMIINLIYNIIIFMGIFDPNYFLLFKKNCDQNWTFVIFLDIILLISCIIFLVYLIDLVEHSEPHSKPKLFFFFMIIFVEFSSIKAVLFFYFFKDKFCVFVDFFELPVFFIITDYFIQMFFYFFELVFLLWIYWRTRGFLDLQKREMVHSFNFSR